MMKNKRFKHIAIFWILVRTELVRTLKTRSRPPEVFLGKSVLKICNKFTGEHPLPKCDFNKGALQNYSKISNSKS